MEYVKIVAKDSVDTWMMKIQKEKTWDIEAVLSDKKMLGIFGDVHEDPNGVLTIQTGEEHHKPHFRSDVLKADLIEPVGSDEEA